MRKQWIWKSLALALMASVCLGLAGCGDDHSGHDHDKDGHHEGDGHDDHDKGKK